MDSGLGFVQPMFFVGVVEDRYDPRAEGRVRVRAFGVHGSNRDIPTDELPWATLIIGNHDVNFTPPPLNAWVFGFFIDGRDAQQPMILGLIPAAAAELVDPETKGWGSIPSENFDRLGQGSRARDLGLSPMSKLATGEFLNETYNEALETNRVRDISIAGGGIRGHNSIGNGNLWSNDVNESADAPAPPRRGPIGASEQASIDGLDNDQEFQAELRRLSQKHGISREQVYGIIAGESSYNPSVVNRFGYAGFFQFGREALADINRRQGTNHTPQSIAQLSPAAQLRVYDTYLDRWNFRNSSGLGVMQAAPAFASRPGPTEVYAQGTAAWRNNPGWRGPDGRITVDSINAYYNRRNPPPTDPASGPQLLEDPSQPGPIQQAQLNEQRQSRADEIRTRIAAIDIELETASGPEEAQPLVEERAQLEEELKQIEGSGATEGTANEPYSGYANPPADPLVTSSWEEPASGYSTQYPYNRVIETASGHSIELDDTPGAERIMIWHHSGSYIQLTGTSTTHKNMSDSYSVNERNHHVYIGGNNIVTIEGDSHVLVKGNKVEEIEGDYKQIVHGNISVGGAGRVEINGADRTDIRSSSLALDSNVENLNIKTGKNIVFESGETINFKSKNIRIGASENMSVSGAKGLFLQSQGGDVHVKSDGNLFLNPDQNLFLRAEAGTISMQSEGSIRINAGQFLTLRSVSYTSVSSGQQLLLAADDSVNVIAADKMGLFGSEMFIESTGGDTNIVAGSNLNTESAQLNMKAGTAYVESGGALDLKGGHVKVGGGSKVSIDASVVAIDDIIQLANGQATTPEGIQAEADSKEPLEPAQFDEGLGEMGGEIAAQARPAEEPIAAQSEAAAPPPPPDRASPRPERMNIDNPPSTSSRTSTSSSSVTETVTGGGSTITRADGTVTVIPGA